MTPRHAFEDAGRTRTRGRRRGQGGARPRIGVRSLLETRVEDVAAHPTGDATAQSSASRSTCGRRPRPTATRRQTRLMQPQLDQINVVASDLPAVVAFLRNLGLDVSDTLPAWMGHHRRIDSTGTGLVVDVDSSAFAAEWGGLPRGWTGVVLVVRVDDRGAVDALHERACAAGAVSLRQPYDAFWGARTALVKGPDGLVFGFMSPIEPQARTAPPDPTTFA